METEALRSQIELMEKEVLRLESECAHLSVKVREWEEANISHVELFREAYEAWAGSELPEGPKGETAPEEYAYWVIRQMLEPIRRGLYQ